jgi:hypothetical protein
MDFVDASLTSTLLAPEPYLIQAGNKDLATIMYLTEVL